MNKHIINVLSKYNFTYNKYFGYGFIEDYEVNVVNYPSSVGPTFVFSTYLTQSQKNEFIQRVNALKIKLVSCASFDFGVMVTIGAMTGKSFEPKFEETMPKILDILRELEAPKRNICPQSGVELNPVEQRTIVLNGVKIILSNGAIETINSYVTKENEDYKNAPNNYIKGFFGIVIGAIAGVALTIVLWYVGFVTTFAPLLSILLGVFLYKKFGGKQNWVMIVMSFVTTIVFILGAFIVVYAISASIAAAEVGYSFKLFEALKYALANAPEFKRTFYMDLALNTFFILLAEGFSIFRLVKDIKRPQQV